MATTRVCGGGHALGGCGGAVGRQGDAWPRPPRASGSGAGTGGSRAAAPRGDRGAYDSSAPTLPRRSAAFVVPPLLSASPLLHSSVICGVLHEAAPQAVLDVDRFEVVLEARWMDAVERAGRGECRRWGALWRRCGGGSRWCWRSITTTTTRALEDHAELLLLEYSPWCKRITPHGDVLFRRGQGLLQRALHLWHRARLPWWMLLCFYLLFHYYYHKFIVCWSKEDLAMAEDELQPPIAAAAHQGYADEDDPAVAERTLPELTAKRLHVPLSGRRGSSSAIASNRKEHPLSWIQGNAEALGFEDGSMDGSLLISA